jgi:hypothetical protein
MSSHVKGFDWKIVQSTTQDNNMFGELAIGQKRMHTGRGRICLEHLRFEKHIVDVHGTCSICIKNNELDHTKRRRLKNRQIEGVMNYYDAKYAA